MIPPKRFGFSISIWFALLAAPLFAQTETTATLVTLQNARADFQSQELTTARRFTTIFNAGDPPKIIWRDADAVRRLMWQGNDAARAAVTESLNFDTPESSPLLRVRWFNATLDESTTPSEVGRWGAYIEGIAPNGTPLRRSLTFYCRPPMFLAYFFPNQSPVELQPQLGTIAEESWAANQAEINLAAKQWMIQGLNDTQPGAQFLSAWGEGPKPPQPAPQVVSAVPAGGSLQPSKQLSTAAYLDEEFHLKLKLKLQGKDSLARPLAPPRVVPETRTGAFGRTETPALHKGTHEEAGVHADAKKRIDAYCRLWAKDSGVPFVGLVARHGVIISHEAYGVDQETSKPITEDYRCDVASITKTASALLFSRFVDQKRIALDDPVSWVFNDYPTTGPWAANVPTFRQLFTHTSGLTGHSSWEGVRNPHLENIVLNGIDALRPGREYIYNGTGFDLAGKAMETMTGKTALRLFHEDLFGPLGLPNVEVGTMGSGLRVTAWELGVLGQWMANEGSYGNLQFIAPETFQLWLPESVGKYCPGVTEEYGIGMRWMRDCKPDAPGESTDPKDWVLSPRTIGHGSLSQCMLQVDLERDLVIVQVRRHGSENHGMLARGFLQTVVDCLVEDGIE